MVPPSVAHSWFGQIFASLYGNERKPVGPEDARRASAKIPTNAQHPTNRTAAAQQKHRARFCKAGEHHTAQESTLKPSH